LLVPVEDAQSLGRAIGSVLDDSDLSRRLAEGAQHRAQDFDVTHMTRAYEQLFRELTHGTP